MPKSATLSSAFGRGDLMHDPMPRAYIFARTAATILAECEGKLTKLQHEKLVALNTVLQTTTGMERMVLYGKSWIPSWKKGRDDFGRHHGERHPGAFPATKTLFLTGQSGISPRIPCLKRKW